MSRFASASQGRRFGLISAAVLTLAAAGCDQGAPPEPRPQIKIANPLHEQLSELSPDMQRLGLMRAIRDNGRRCKRVEAVRYQQDYEQMALWIAQCDDDRQWAIFIAPNGDTQVRPCTEMRQLGLPQCGPVTPPGEQARGEG